MLISRGAHTGALRSATRLVVLLAALAFAFGCDDPPGTTDGEGASSNALPFKTDGDYLAYWDGSQYQPFFMTGINLGVGIPGSEPGQLAVTRGQYRRWLEEIAATGVNTLRVYTLHFPRFYEEFREYNLAHPERPLYLVQGIWLDEENPTHDFFNMTEIYDQEIRNVVHALHGNADVVGTYGKAFGEYRADVSPWLMSWILGREIYPDEVEFTNEVHAEVTSYDGTSMSIQNAMPMEAWLTERLDYAITLERETYNVTRPVCFSTWPTLDPLTHLIEGQGSDEDRVNMDLGKIDMHDAPGGLWIIYHAYPYYPDFVVETPEYQLYQDAVGFNSYLGYLTDLKRYHGRIPIVIGEFGTPSAWGAAHYAQSGMHHGGLDEAVVGHFAARMFYNIYSAGMAGGIYFAWMDEWWKRTWITDELDFPRGRRFRWHNVTAAEQNFGLIAFDLGPPSWSRWEPVAGEGAVREVEADADAEFFHVRVTLDGPLEGSDIPLIIGWDTYRDDLGESTLPGGTVTAQRSEFATVIGGDLSANHLVTRAYDSYGIWHNSSNDLQLFHSIPTDGAPWMLVRWKNNQAHISRDSLWQFPETADEIGQLHVRREGESPSNLDAVVFDGSTITVRIPWSLLHVTDPTRRAVLDDDRTTQGRETAITDGFRLAVEWGGDLVTTPRLQWDTWEEAPPTVEREKPSLALLTEIVRYLPHDLPSGLAEDRPAVPDPFAE
ncbi:MAG: hypothetical protein H6700_10735 [Myxococcales bacterium]|nr:hypothetical protein [Myxococcales bacterium]MCB9520877.1 hypothetical protein [Myxococcales bacterium]MCB9532231.1 hypothetical protein [Myxococcales bacterium]